MSDGPPATTSWGMELSGQFSIDMIAKFWHNASPKGSLINGLSFMYKLSRFSKLAISSGMNCRLFSPTDKYVKFDRCPIVRGNAVIWFDCKINFCRSCNNPISAGILKSKFDWMCRYSMVWQSTYVPSKRFSSKSKTLNLRKLPIVVGIFFSRLFERIKISSCWRHWMSSGSFEIEFVPRFNSTMFVQLPRSSGNCVWRIFGIEIKSISNSNASLTSEFSFMLSFVSALAREKIPYGILSIWLCSRFKLVILSWNIPGPKKGERLNFS